jgi:hypothetical protein
MHSKTKQVSDQVFDTLNLSELSKKEIRAVLRDVKSRVAKQATTGAPVLIWNWLAENPGLTTPELCELLHRHGRIGVKPHTVSAIRYHSLGMARALAAKGHLTGLSLDLG